MTEIVVETPTDIVVEVLAPVVEIVEVSTPGPQGSTGPTGPQGPSGQIVLGLNDPVPAGTPINTVIVRKLVA